MSRDSWIYVGLGGNVGGLSAVAARFDRVIRQLARAPWVAGVAASSVYRTASVGHIEQADFLNAVLALAPSDPPPATSVLVELLAIEARLGRDRTDGQRNGPRPIDIDLLLFGGDRIRDPGPPELVVPHPRMTERAFVLAPLVEIAGPDLRIPGQPHTAGECLRAASEQRVERLDPLFFSPE